MQRRRGCGLASVAVLDGSSGEDAARIGGMDRAGRGHQFGYQVICHKLPVGAHTHAHMPHLGPTDWGSCLSAILIPARDQRAP